MSISWTDFNEAGGDGDAAHRSKFQRYNAAGNKLGWRGDRQFRSSLGAIRSISGLLTTDDGGFTLVWIESINIEYRRFDANGTSARSGATVLLSSVGQSGIGKADDLGPRICHGLSEFQFCRNAGHSRSNVPGQRRYRPAPQSPSPLRLTAKIGPGHRRTGRRRFRSRLGRRKRPSASGFVASTPGASRIPLPRSMSPTWRIARSSGASITPLANGSFVVAWANNNTDLLGYGRVGTGSYRYRPRRLIGTEFTVNTYTTDGIQIAAAALPRWRTAASWPCIKATATSAARYSTPIGAQGRQLNSWSIPRRAILSGSPGGWRARRRAFRRHLDGPRHKLIRTIPIATAVRLQVFDPRDGVVNGTANADTLYGHDLVQRRDQRPRRRRHAERNGRCRQHVRRRGQ